MCGIAGIIGAKNNRNVMQVMLETQHHRGPDATGIWTSASVVLGHNRLAIIDLSEESNQPFVWDNWVMVFNGEIYNYLELKEQLSHHTFKTTSDTEVLLAAYLEWGKDCLSRLNGMFAFAIWNTKTKSLFAARDRFGVKPFYYSFFENQFYFASEIKTLHAAGIPKEPNEHAWASYFVYGSYATHEQTFWETILQLPAGHFLEYQQENLIIEKWYFFEEIIKNKTKQNLTEESVKKQYIALLKDSIRLRFRADVMVGFNISGGLDSSVLLAMVNQQSETNQINAFTFYTNDERYDELPWVTEMIQLTKNPLHKVLLTSDENLISKIKVVVANQDEPCGGIPTVAYSELFKAARLQEVLVLLDGQGMDEQWAGYDYYLNDSQEVIQGVQQSPFKPTVLSKEFLAKAIKPVYPKPFKEEMLNKQYRDLFYTKIPRALRFNDRVSMAYSTELREPFLDHRLVEFAFSLPKEFKIKQGVQKFLLREIAAEMLSDNIAYAPKRPLQTPQREWFQQDLYDFIQEQLIAFKKSNFSHWFLLEEINKELKKYKEAELDSSFHIWQWLNTCLLLLK